ncbi:MAG: restriction endonuclease subunit S [Fluviicola sp.]|nr:restriction endonuclease subunit S [Fluviicola sp.]
MKKYDSYKNSEVKWLGEIPIHWNVTKLKFIGNAIGGLTYTPNDIVEDETNGKLVLRSSNIQDGKLSLVDNVYVKSEISEKLTLKKGDILICSRNGSQHLIGKNICIDERTEGHTFGAFMMIFRSKYYSFLNHFFNSPIFTSQSGLFLTATINQLTSGTLNNFYIALPESLEEQTSIANYLDHKTAQIDDLIANKERLIQLLEEERIAIINQAVTKGLDPSVPMKDSGIEWLAEIPEGWVAKKIKYIATLQSGDNITSEEIEEKGSYPVYGGNGLRGYYSKYTNEGNYILIGRQGALCGNVKYAQGKFWASEHAIVCYLKEEYNWKWFGKLMESMNLNQYNQSAAQPGLAVGAIINLSIPTTSLSEQEKIIEFISDYESKTDNLILKYRQEIELLKEYKTALISEVVTGKMDVRDYSEN